MVSKIREKQRVTAFVDPIIVKRARIRGALEELTISEVVEKALDAYAPEIEKIGGQHIRLKFSNNHITQPQLPKKGPGKAAFPVKPTVFRPTVP